MRPHGLDLPKVVILGRPNVGKSTLFNALLRRRRAITHSRAGVTRDPVEAECRLGGKRVVLVDTGGFAPDAEGVDAQVATRSLQAAEEADLILMVLDALEMTPADEEYLSRLRPYSARSMLVVNKVDTPEREPLVWNAHAHGFAHVIGVSAVHGRGLGELGDLVAQLLEKAGDERRGAAEPASAPIRIALVGKPNTGKSSLANRLEGQDRSLVSERPGTTRDVVEGGFQFQGRTFQILDTAGIRRKSRVHDAVEYYSVNRAIESISDADLIFLMVDAREGLVDQDKKIAAQGVKLGRGIVIVLNKWDLLDGTPSLLASTRERVRFDFPILSFAPVVPTSALTGYGIRGLLDTAVDLWEQLHHRVGTGKLNQALPRWVAHYKLPVRGKNIAIRYVTQVGVNPVRFVVFVNRLAGFPRSYAQYLENCIRRDLGFSLVPVQIELRQSAKSPR